EGTAIDVHFVAVEFPYHTAGQDPFDESVALQDEVFASRRAHRLEQGARLLVELAPLKRPYDRFHVNDALERRGMAPLQMKAQRRPPIMTPQRHFLPGEIERGEPCVQLTDMVRQ